MGPEAIRAIFFGGFGLAVDVLMFALDHLGVRIPPLVLEIAVVVSVASILIAIALALHLGWNWVRSRGWGRQMGFILIGLGVLIGVGLVAGGVYTIRNPAAQPVPGRAPNEITADTAPHARIKVIRIEFVPTSDGTGDIEIKAIYKNLGTKTGFAPAKVKNSYVGPPLSREKYDGITTNVRTAVLSLKPPRKVEMDVNGIEGFEPISRLHSADWAKVNNGGSTLYVWVALASADVDLPERDSFISEFVIIKSGGDGYEIDSDKFYSNVIKTH